MFAEFKHTLRRLRGQIVGWGIGLGLYGLMMVSLFDSIVNIEGIEELLANYPPELMAFFGDSMTGFTSPEGYIDLYYFFYMPVIIGIFAVSVGASLLVGDEEKGTLDLILAYPVSRTALFWGRWLGFAAATAVILFISWLSWTIPAGSVGLDLTWLELLRPFIPLLAILLFWGGLALLLSYFLPSARAASMTTGSLLVANFLLNGLANANEDLTAVTEYLPLHFFQSGDAIGGINGRWLTGLLAAAVAFALLAWLRFQRRDIRVGGEGSWSLTSLFRRRQ
jgi:ABC-2 type transport system permease protein